MVKRPFQKFLHWTYRVPGDSNKDDSDDDDADRNHENNCQVKSINKLNFYCPLGKRHFLLSETQCCVTLPIGDKIWMSYVHLKTVQWFRSKKKRPLWVFLYQNRSHREKMVQKKRMFCTKSPIISERESLPGNKVPTSKRIIDWKVAKINIWSESRCVTV